MFVWHRHFNFGKLLTSFVFHTKQHFETIFIVRRVFQYTTERLAKNDLDYEVC